MYFDEDKCCDCPYFDNCMNDNFSICVYHVELNEDYNEDE